MRKDDMHDAAIEGLQDLVRAEGQGPEAVRRTIAARMRAAGAAVETLAYRPAEVPMIEEFAHASVAADARETVTIGRVGGGGGGRSLILFAHPDTEPHRTDPGWRSAPFEPTVRRGRLHGWGVADDLAGCAMLADALLALEDAGLRPAGDVTLVAAPSKRHRRGIGAALHAGLRADAALYLHPAESGRGLGEIKAFAPGQLEFTLTVGGVPPETAEPAHTAFAHRGVNAISNAMAVVAALEALDRERGERIHHPRLEAAIGRSTNLMVTHIEAGGADVTTRLPETCRLRAALSLVPGERLETAMREVEEALAVLASADPRLADHPPSIEWLAGVSAAETADDHPFLSTVTEAIVAAGTRPVVNPLHTSSDIRNPIVQAGIPTLGIGPSCGDLTMAGGVDEWVDIADYARSVAVVAQIIADWCGTVRARR